MIRYLKISLFYSFIVGIFCFFTVEVSSFAQSKVKLSKEEQLSKKQHQQEIATWKRQRIERLKANDGWLNLVGLHWLQEGENTIGAAKDNFIQLTKGRNYLGVIHFLGDSLVFLPNIGEDVAIAGKEKVTHKLTLRHDEQENTTILEHQTLRFHVIKRENNYGVRVRDIESPLLQQFKGIETYPVSQKWRFVAQLTVDTTQIIRVPNVLGQIEKHKSVGILSFVYQGKKYELTPVMSGNQLFIIFADATNGKTTYKTGRFLYADLPDKNGEVILDFNKAYNPPCYFTDYATCPLPPRQNILPISIKSGEKSNKKHD